MSFGYTIRAYRLGYRELPWPARGWMRMTTEGDGCRCEFYPLGEKVRTKAREEHVCWWDDYSIIQYSRFLRAIRRINKPFEVVLDYYGEVVNA